MVKLADDAVPATVSPPFTSARAWCAHWLGSGRPPGAPPMPAAWAAGPPCTACIARRGAAAGGAGRLGMQRARAGPPAAPRPRTRRRARSARAPRTRPAGAREALPPPPPGCTRCTWRGVGSRASSAGPALPGGMGVGGRENVEHVGTWGSCSQCASSVPRSVKLSVQVSGYTLAARIITQRGAPQCTIPCVET